jgi:uncharacterized protein DUF2442
MLSIVSALPLDGHCLHLVFNDGREGNVDFLPMLAADLPAPFHALRDRETLLNFDLGGGTLRWPGNLDLAPEYLYFQAFRNDKSLQQKFVEWGYSEESLVNA